MPGASRDWGCTFVNSADGSISLATSQMSMKQGQCQFGEDGAMAVKYKTVPSKELTTEQQCEALAYLMFLKCKHCG